MFWVAAFKREINRGWGERGRDWYSGWNWVPIKKGCNFLSSSMASTSLPSGEVPEMISPSFSRRAR